MAENSSKQVLWAQLLPPSLRGGPMARKAYMEKMRSQQRRTDLANMIPAVAPMEDGNDPSPGGQPGFMFGGYTGKGKDGVLQPEKKVNTKTFEDHEGEYYLNHVVTKLLGGPDGVERMVEERLQAIVNPVAPMEDSMGAGGDAQAIQTQEHTPAQMAAGAGNQTDVPEVVQPGGMCRGGAVKKGYMRGGIVRRGYEEGGPVVEDPYAVAQPLDESTIPYVEAKPLDQSTIPTVEAKPAEGTIQQSTQVNTSIPSAATQETILPKADALPQVSLPNAVAPVENVSRFEATTLPKEGDTKTENGQNMVYKVWRDSGGNIVNQRWIPQYAASQTDTGGGTAADLANMPTEQYFDEATGQQITKEEYQRQHPELYPQPVVEPVEEEEITTKATGDEAEIGDADTTNMYRQEGMRQLMDIARGNNEVYESLLRSALQQSGASAVQGEMALRQQLAAQGITGAAANAIMNAYQRNVRSEADALRGDIVQKIMEDARSAAGTLASEGFRNLSLNEQMRQFNETHQLAVENFKSQEGWKLLGAMIDGGQDVEDINKFVKDTWGLDVNFQNVADSQQANRYGAAASNLATIVTEYVTGGNRDGITIDQPEMSNWLRSMWINSGNAAGDIGSDAYNEWAQGTLDTMVNVNNPINAVIASFTNDELIDAFVGDDFFDARYGGDIEAYKSDIKSAIASNGLGMDVVNGVATFSVNPGKWEFLLTPDANDIVALDKFSDVAAGDTFEYGGKTYVVDEPGVKAHEQEETEVVGEELDLQVGIPQAQDGVVYTKAADGAVTTFSIDDYMATDYAGGSAAWSDNANLVMQFGTDAQKQRVTDDRAADIVESEDYTRLRSLSSSDPVYKAVETKLGGVLTIQYDANNIYDDKFTGFEPIGVWARYTMKNSDGSSRSVIGRVTQYKRIDSSGADEPIIEMTDYKGIPYWSINGVNWYVGAMPTTHNSNPIKDWD